MGILSRFQQRIADGYKASRGNTGLPQNSAYGNSSAAGGWWSRLFGLLPGAKVDYRAEADPAWLNSIVASALNYVGRNLPQAPPAVYRIRGKEEVIIPGHELAAILKRPNKYYDGIALLKATFLSLMAGRGQAYWWIRRNNDNSPRELWYLPHWQCWPIWDKDATTDNWIRGYAYRNQGIIYELPFDDVIHFRDGLDPYNLRAGLDPIGSAYRELCYDNEVSGYNVALLKNFGVVPVILSPAEATDTIEDADMQLLKAQWEDTTTGDNRGRPLVMNSGVRVDKIGLSPSEMDLGRNARSETRIAALLGIHPMSLGLEFGLERGTLSNYEQAEKSSWFGGIIPRLMLIAAACDVQLLNFYAGASTKRVGFDTSKVPALQENRETQFGYLSLAVGGPFLTRNEARSIISLDKISGGDELYPPPSKGALGVSPLTKQPAQMQENERPQVDTTEKNGSNGNGNKALIA